MLCLLALCCTGAAPAGAFGDLHFLIGKWSCSFAMGTQRGVYTATYAVALDGAGLLQTDTWTGGGGDAGMYSYDASTHRFNETVVVSSGQTTVFLGTPEGSKQIAYRSVYPDASAREIFQRISDSQYTLDYHQTQHGKTLSSKDICRKI